MKPSHTPPTTSVRTILASVVLLSARLGPYAATHATENPGNAAAVLGRVAAHDFHPIRDGFTYDRGLNRHGVASLECPDLFPCRVMVGQELEPKYWFSKTSFKDFYTKNIWWPHLVDRAGAVGAEYGVHPLAFTVHAEWINRPSVVIVDKEGVARFAYYGTFWGDRPTIHQRQEMVRSGDYSFAAPKRLKAASNR